MYVRYQFAVMYSRHEWNGMEFTGIHTGTISCFTIEL